MHVHISKRADVLFVKLTKFAFALLLRSGNVISLVSRA